MEEPPHMEPEPVISKTAGTPSPRRIGGCTGHQVPLSGPSGSRGMADRFSGGQRMIRYCARSPGAATNGRSSGFAPDPREKPHDRTTARRSVGAAVRPEVYFLVDPPIRRTFPSEGIHVRSQQVVDDQAQEGRGRRQARPDLHALIKEITIAAREGGGDPEGTRACARRSTTPKRRTCPPTTSIRRSSAEPASSRA